MSTGDAAGAGDDRGMFAAQCAFAALLFGAWEAAGRLFGSAWTSLPSEIAVRLAEWAASGLHWHVLTTASEVVIGLVIGGTAGVVAGLLLGRSRVVSVVVRPFVIALYSVPLVTMAPLLILWFGLDMAPKIVLVTVVVFFLVFFSTFAGVRSIDADLVASFQLMGSTRREEFRKVIAPASMAWILSGIKIALPYALVAATTGELLAARQGLGFLLSRAASQFDMTGLYAALFVLMLLGIVTNGLAELAEKRALRWRDAAQ